MTIKIEASGHRSIEADVEVPGTPEEVWKAIATGPGVSSWFVPTTFEESDGKAVAISSTFGPGMTARAAVTTWNPPRMFAAQGESWGGAPPMATEWNVEPQPGGLCHVRVVHRIVAATDEWDPMLEGAKGSWPSFFRALRIYLTHFRGQRSELSQFVTPVAGTEAQAWEMLTTALGQKDLRVGQHWNTPAGVPPLGGLAEYVSESPYDTLVRLDQPGPGIAALGAFDCMNGQSMVAMNLYFYGDQAAETAARETPIWRAWFQECFPTPPEAGQNE